MQGHGRDGEHRVPRHWRDTVVDWARSGDAESTVRRIGARALRFRVEPTREGSMHACTVDDVAHVLRSLPSGDLVSEPLALDIEGVVFRQQTRKEEALGGAWGRLGYFCSVGTDSFGRDSFGTVVQLTATEIPFVQTWPRSLGPDDQRELARLAHFADDVSAEPRGTRLTFELTGVRRVQLMYTLIHEVGHYVDYATKLGPPVEEHERLRPGDEEGLWALMDRLDAHYFARPHREREQFAERYAERMRAALEARGVFADLGL